MTDWLRAVTALEHRDGVLVTVVGVQGSAPREPGAKMVVTAEGLRGTIGGGRLEHEAVAAARALLAGGGAPTVRRVALGPHLGQCCGGVVSLLFERLDDATWLAAVRAHVDASRPCVVATVVGPEGTAVPAPGARLVVAETGSSGAWDEPELASAARSAARKRLTEGGAAATTLELLGRTVLLDPVGSEPSIVVFGAGHIGRALVSILGGFPCRVTWIDARTDEFPRVVPANVTIEPSDAPELDVVAAAPGSYFVVATHSHQLDLAVSERILGRDDFAYFGLVGSAAKRRRFERRLLLRGISAAALARMRCPAGVDGIRGKHPGEIAVAIAAELLVVRGLREAAREGPVPRRVAP